MLNRIREWNEKYQLEISWFFIGYFTFDLIISIAKDNITSILIDIIFIVVSYYLYRKKYNESN